MAWGPAPWVILAAPARSLDSDLASLNPNSHCGLNSPPLQAWTQGLGKLQESRVGGPLSPANRPCPGKAGQGWDKERMCRRPCAPYQCLRLLPLAWRKWLPPPFRPRSTPPVPGGGTAGRHYCTALLVPICLMGRLRPRAGGLSHWSTGNTRGPQPRMSRRGCLCLPGNLEMLRPVQPHSTLW